MSFYGSVYYQLIDTYYKIIVKNGGDKTFDFNKALINPSGTADIDLIESPAVGRKGVFTLDSGNYWINFSKIEDESGAPYRIWHAEPHYQQNNPQIGFYHRPNNEYYDIEVDGDIETIYEKGTRNELIEGTHYIQLDEHDFF